MTSQGHLNVNAEMNNDETTIYQRLRSVGPGRSQVQRGIAMESESFILDSAVGGRRAIRNDLN